MFDKNLSNDKGLEENVAISQKNLSCKRGSLLGNEEHHLGGDLPIFEIIYSNLEQRSIFS